MAETCSKHRFDIDSGVVHSPGYFTMKAKRQRGKRMGKEAHERCFAGESALPPYSQLNPHYILMDGYGWVRHHQFIRFCLPCLWGIVSRTPLCT